MIKREIIDTILSNFRRKKIIVLLGPRQVGKTTLLSQIGLIESKNILMLNCDNIDDTIAIEDKTSTELRTLIEPYDIVFIDEAQRVKNIGLTLKKIGDLKLSTQVIVTGSSSLGMSDDINEPATGRLVEFNLFPLSLPEMAADSSEREESRMLNTRLIYGLYPEVVTDSKFAKQLLVSLSNNYLYKDIFSYKGIKKPDMIVKLSQALALQLGSEVSYNELAQLLGIDKATVETYINLLEKCFIVFRVDSFSRNMRNEIKRGKKIFFYDNGIRNAIIANFAPPELRTDMGALWENMMVAERRKRNSYHQIFAHTFFWRNTNQQEIDLIEDIDGRLSAFEFKWNPRAKAKIPISFVKAYPDAEWKVITPDNFWEFVK